MQPVSQAYAESMKSPLREKGYIKITIGEDLEYSNSDVLSSTLDMYTSATGEMLPQIDFNVTLINDDGRFDPENPDNPLAVIRAGTPVEIQYGYDLPLEEGQEEQETEWILGAKLYYSSWNVDENGATVFAVDGLRGLTGTVVWHTSSPMTLYAAAEAIFSQAGITDYRIDNIFKNLRLRNPIPAVSYKEALQMIANMGLGKVELDRDGTIGLDVENIPGVSSVSSTTPRYYSVPSNVVNYADKIEYANFDPDYIVVDGTHRFPPPLASQGLLESGFVSQSVSDNSGAYTGAFPRVNVLFERTITAQNLKIVFGDAYPATVYLILRNGATTLLTQSLTVTRKIISIPNSVIEDMEFDSIGVEFRESQVANSRALVNQIMLDVDPVFDMTKNDMMSLPMAAQEVPVSQVVVPFTQYTAGSSEEAETVYEDVVEATSLESPIALVGFVETYYSSLAVYVDDVLSEDAETEIYFDKIWVSVPVSTLGEHTIRIDGIPYSVTEGRVEVTVGDTGEPLEWANPLIDNAATAQNVALWLADYYTNPIEYEYEYRGNPELDPGDILYQENRVVENMRVKILENTIIFNQSFAGRIRTRKL